MKLVAAIWKNLGTGLCVLAVVVPLAGCKKPKVVEPPTKVAVVAASELAANRLEGLPGPVYRAAASSPIHWQQWSAETFAKARAVDRMVFVFIGSPQYPESQAIANQLAADPVLVEIINREYVPVMVDGDSSREVSLVAMELLAQNKQPARLPVFAWLSPEANPVGWISVPESTPEELRAAFDKCHNTVSTSWSRQRDYVMENSRRDNAARSERYSVRTTTRLGGPDPAGDAVRAIRRFSSLYDPVSHSFDDTGGLFPTGPIDTLATAVLNRKLPQDLRERCSTALQGALGNLLPSPMFDPLDGGLFSSRQSSTWAMPRFQRNGERQAQAVTSLCRAYQATGMRPALDRALAVLAHLEIHHLTAEGLVAQGNASTSPTRDWLWTVDDIRNCLPPEDAEWWMAATGMRPLGNLPSEADPARRYFRCNSISLTKSMAELAADLGVTPERFKPRYEAAVSKLLAVRNARLGTLARDPDAHAAASFRMVTAYAAAYTATGDAAYREKAVALLNKARAAFTDGPLLWQFTVRTAPSVSAGRTYHYCLALQACLDVTDITGDDVWLDWADDLATTSAELFAKQGFLKECPDNAKVLDLPITDLIMVFGDSSAGLVSTNESRMAARGRPLLESFTSLATPFPKTAIEGPVFYTDLIHATLTRHFAPVALIGASVSPELADALARLPLRVVNRRTATRADAVAAGSIKIVLPGEQPVVVKTPAELREAVLPSAAIR